MGRLLKHEIAGRQRSIGDVTHIFSPKRGPAEDSAADVTASTN